MQLHTLMKLVKNHFMVDEKLKVYIYEDRIDFIDYTSPIELPDGETLNEFNGRLITMYYRDSVIIAIEPQSLNLITPRNTGLYKFLCDLIETKIDDLKSYPVISEKDNEDLVQIL